MSEQPVENKTESDTPTANQKTKHGCLTKGCGCLVIFLLILTGLIAYAPRLIPTEWIKQAVVKTVKEKINRDCTLDEITVGWFDGVDISGFKIRGEKNAEPIIAAKKLRLVVNIFDLAGGNLSIDSFVIEGGTLNIIRGSDGSFNIEKMLASNPPKKQKIRDGIMLMSGPKTATQTTQSFVLKSLRLVDSTINYTDEAAGTKTSWHVEDLIHTGSDINRQMTLKGKINLGNDKSAGNITLDGTLDMLENNTLDMKGSANLRIEAYTINIAGLLKKIGISINPLEKGIISGRLDLNVVKGEPRFAIREIILANGEAKLCANQPPVTFPDIKLSCIGAIEGEGDFSGRKITASKIAVKSPLFNCVDLPQNRFDMQNGKIDMTLNCNLDGEKSYKLLSQLGYSSPEIKTLKGTANCNVIFTQDEKGSTATLNLESKQITLSVPSAFTKETVINNINAVAIISINDKKHSTTVELRQANLNIPDNDLTSPITILLSSTASYDSKTNKIGIDKIILSSPVGRLSLPAPIALSVTDKRILIKDNVLLTGNLDTAKLLSLIKDTGLSKDATIEGASEILLSANNTNKGTLQLLTQVNGKKLIAKNFGKDRPSEKIPDMQAILTTEYDPITGKVSFPDFAINGEAIKARVKLPNTEKEVISFAVKITPEKALAFFSGIGYPVDEVPLLSSSGHVFYGGENITLKNITLEGETVVDGKKAPLRGRLNLTMGKNIATTPSLALEKGSGITLGVNGNEILIAELEQASLSGSYEKPEGAMQFKTLRGKSLPVIRFLDGLGLRYPGLGKITSGFTSMLMISTNFNADGQTLTIKDGWAEGNIAMKMRNSRVSIRNSPQQQRITKQQYKPIFANDAPTLGCNFGYSITTGEFILRNFSLASSPAESLKLAAAMHIKPLAGNDAIIDNTKVKITALNLDKFGEVFPIFAPQGYKFGGNLTTEVSASGRLSALKLNSGISTNGMTITIGSDAAANKLYIPKGVRAFEGTLDLIGKSDKIINSDYAFLQGVSLDDGNFAIGDIQYGSAILRNIRGVTSLRDGIFRVEKVGVDIDGQLNLGFVTDLNPALPPCATSIATGKSGIKIAVKNNRNGAEVSEFSSFIKLILPVLEQYAKVDGGVIHMPDSNVPGAKPMVIYWNGLDENGIFSTMRSEPVSIRIDNINLRYPMGKDQLGSLIGLKVIDQLDESILKVLFRPFGLKYGDDEKEGELNYAFSKIAGKIHFAPVDKGGKKLSCLFLDNIRADGIDAADYMITGWFCPGDMTFDIQFTLVDHVERTYNYKSIIKKLSKRLPDRLDSALEKAFDDGFHKAMKDGDIYFKLKGSVDNPNLDHKQIGKILERIFKDIGKTGLLEEGANQLIDSLFGGKKKDNKKDKKKDAINNALKGLLGD